MLRSGETSFEYERVVQPRPKLGRWAAELEGLLTGNAAKSAREQLTLIRIFEELRGRGYDGGYDAVHRKATLIFTKANSKSPASGVVSTGTATLTGLGASCAMGRGKGHRARNLHGR